MKFFFSNEARKFVKEKGGVCTIISELFSGSC